MSDRFAALRALVDGRRNVSPRRLVAPGPDAAQLDQLLALAAAAPDHGRLVPWRFILVPGEARGRLGDVFAQALLERDASATPQQLADAREKAFRAPLLLVAVARLGTAEPDIPPLERVVSMGAAIQNLLLGAEAMGFGAGLTSGQAMDSPGLRTLCGLAEGERAVCMVNLGTVSRRKEEPASRPAPSAILGVLRGD